MLPQYPPSESRSFAERWRNKFACALRGMVVAVRAESSFTVHLLAAMAVIAMGWGFRVTHAEWLTLILCITVVLAAELFNTAIERLARAITCEENADIRDALDIASGAVLATAIGAKITWVTIFAFKICG